MKSFLNRLGSSSTKNKDARKKKTQQSATLPELLPIPLIAAIEIQTAIVPTTGDAKNKATPAPTLSFPNPSRAIADNVSVQQATQPNTQDSQSNNAHTTDPTFQSEFITEAELVLGFNPWKRARQEVLSKMVSSEEE